MAFDGIESKTSRKITAGYKIIAFVRKATERPQIAITEMVTKSKTGFHLLELRVLEAKPFSEIRVCSRMT